MSVVARIFDEMPSRYLKGKVSKRTVFYFSVGSTKTTVTLEPDSIVVQPDTKVDDADVVLKTTPELFEKMVIKGKMPGPLDIARGRVKTNDPMALKNLRTYFDFTGIS